MPTRYLKPGICDSETIDRCSPLAETLWYRLLVNVDDFGRMDARPAVVRAKCWPLKDSITNAMTLDMLVELQSCGLIIIYESNACVYLQMQKWDNIPRARESKCPPYSDNCIQLHTSACNGNTVLPVTVTVTVTETETDKPKHKPKTVTETKDLSPPLASTKKGTALPVDWALPKAWGEWALSERQDLRPDDVRRIADTFKDHWLANANRANGKKADWMATWRNWVRNSKGVNGVNFKTAGERRMEVTDRAIAEWLGDSGGLGSAIEGEFNNA